MTTDEKREWLVQFAAPRALQAAGMPIDKVRAYFWRQHPDVIEQLFLYYLKQSMKE